MYGWEGKREEKVKQMKIKTADAERIAQSSSRCVTSERRRRSWYQRVRPLIERQCTMTDINEK
jgi:hypothetical protein